MLTLTLQMLSSFQNMEYKKCESLHTWNLPENKKRYKILGCRLPNFKHGGLKMKLT